MVLYPLILVSGRPNSGKDTFVSLVSEILERDYNISCVYRSSIDTIKEVAKMLGWDGNKNEKSREFLSKLKELSIWFNNYPFIEISKLYTSNIDKSIVFSQVREPKEIEKLKKIFGKMCITVMLKSNRSLFCGNDADFSCEKYNYDMTVRNDGNIEDLTKYCKNVFVSYLLELIRKYPFFRHENTMC